MPLYSLSARALSHTLILRSPVPVGHWRPLLTTASIMQVSNVSAPSDKLQPLSPDRFPSLFAHTHTHIQAAKGETNERSGEVLTLR